MQLFIIQACRGGKFDYGVESEATDLGEGELKDLVESKYDVITKKVKDLLSFLIILLLASHSPINFLIGS